MKEFEKWWDSCEDVKIPQNYGSFMIGWKAALEWTLSCKEEIDINHYGCTIPIEMIYAATIKKELEE